MTQYENQVELNLNVRFKNGKGRNILDAHMAMSLKNLKQCLPRNHKRKIQRVKVSKGSCTSTLILCNKVSKNIF